MIWSTLNPQIWSVVPIPIAGIYSKLYRNMCLTFWVILQTDKQADKRKDKNKNI